MYRYSGEGALLENMYLMASVFRHYNIHAVFVFDGPPPPQKTEVIELRKKKKDESKKEYDRLAKLSKEKRVEGNITTTEVDDIEETMRELKKQFIRLHDCDITSVKELLLSFGFAMIDAEGEADALCAKLSICKRVDACMSDDTDMFVYGCPIVLRNISLLNHSIIQYNMTEILKTLALTQQEFKMMCVVSGTDYSHGAAHDEYISPDTVFKKLTKFKSLSMKDQGKYHESGGGFYDWYVEQQQPTTTTAAAADVSRSAITYLTNESMFDVSTSGNGYKQLVVLNRENIHRKRIIEIMMKEDFIFIDSTPSDDAIIRSLSSGNGSLTSSPVYGVDHSPENANDAKAFANEIYGINASSFKELHKIHRKQRRGKAK
jgi:5'-3' exonuclease